MQFHISVTKEAAAKRDQLNDKPNKQQELKEELQSLIKGFHQFPTPPQTQKNNLLKMNKWRCCQTNL